MSSGAVERRCQHSHGKTDIDAVVWVYMLLFTLVTQDDGLSIPASFDFAEAGRDSGRRGFLRAFSAVEQSVFFPGKLIAGTASAIPPVLIPRALAKVRAYWCNMHGRVVNHRIQLYEVNSPNNVSQMVKAETNTCVV